MSKTLSASTTNALALTVLLFLVHTEPTFAGLYENQVKGFSCIAPSDGWELSELSSGARWHTANESVVLSVVHISDIPVAITPEYLEELFNGLDSIEKTELTESNRGTLNGCPAYTSVRRHKNGSLTRTTVLVVGQRGFSMNITASELGHKQYGQIYNQMVSSFRAEAGSAPKTVQKNQQEASKQSPSSPPLPHLFRGRGLGFTVNYPSGWEAERLDDTTVQILGPGNAEGSRISALIMHQGSPGAGATPESLMEKLRAQILGDYPKAKFYPAKKVALADGLLTGQQCVAEYYEGWEQKRQWQGILKKADGAYIVMLVSGPLELMEANIPNVNSVINSLSPTR